MLRILIDWVNLVNQMELESKQQEDLEQTSEVEEDGKK